MKPLAMHRVVSFFRAGDKLINMYRLGQGSMSVIGNHWCYSVHYFVYSTINHSSDDENNIHTDLDLSVTLPTHAHGSRRVRIFK